MRIIVSQNERPVGAGLIKATNGEVRNALAAAQSPTRSALMPVAADAAQELDGAGRVSSCIADLFLPPGQMINIWAPEDQLFRNTRAQLQVGA